MATYTVRSHPELDDITEIDKGKLTKVIKEYNEWYDRHNHDFDREHEGQAAWIYAMYNIKDYINENMVDELSTLEETQGVQGDGFSIFPVSAIFSEIDTIREELLHIKVHSSLLEKEPVLLMHILNRIQECTRRVIQNTSIQRLHKKSWVHADALRGLDGVHAPGAGDEAWREGGAIPKKADITTLLRQMRQLCV
jgi:hypothetical protein